MNPQCGYYQNGQRFSGGTSSGASYRPGVAGARMYSGARSSGPPMQPARSRSTYGYCNDQGPRTRAAPVFPSASYGNFSGSASQGYPAQASCNRNGNGYRQQPQTRAIPLTGNNNYRMAHQQPQQCCNQQPLAPAPFCTPQAIKVNVTAEQLANAKSTPYQDRGEPSLEENPGAKYIQLNWQDLLGGMDNLRVSMVPSADPDNQNRQLKVSFGGQKTDPPQAGETSLKVLSIEPANSGRMDIQNGNALAGSMKICNSPVTNISPTPSNCQPRSQPYYGAASNRQSYGGRSYRQ